MTEQPFFTVIIPTLNEEMHLPRLLSDLGRQKEKAFEVLVVDGGSRDQTLNLAKSFSPQLLLTILRSKKANVSFQRNLGAKHAKGQYLVFFDADVQIPDKFLLLIHQYLNKYPTPFLTTRVRPDSRNMYDVAITRLLNLVMDIGLNVDVPFVGGYNFIVSKAAFVAVGGFREDIKHAEDHELTDRLYKAGYSLVILKAPQLVYSLRRFRKEGRLTVLRKNARAAVHVLTRGPITREIFHYPMGGLWYNLKTKQEIKPAVLTQVRGKINRFLDLFLE